MLQSNEELFNYIDVFTYPIECSVSFSLIPSFSHKFTDYGDKRSHILGHFRNQSFELFHINWMMCNETFFGKERPFSRRSLHSYSQRADLIEKRHLDFLCLPSFVLVFFCPDFLEKRLPRDLSYPITGFQNRSFSLHFQQTSKNLIATWKLVHIPTLLVIVSSTGGQDW